MMNNTLYAQLVDALDALTDAQGKRILAIAQAYANMGDADTGVTGASVQAPAPKREYEPATDVTIPVTFVGGRKTAFTLGYGAGRAGAKELIRSLGIAWDASVARKDGSGKTGAWVGTSKAIAALNVQYDDDTMQAYLPVSAEWVQAGRDKAQAKAERKARKAGA